MESERTMTGGAFRCLLCDGGGFRPWLKDCQDYYLGKPVHANYVECVGCRLIQQHPIPTDLKSLYDGYPVHQEQDWVQRLSRRLFHRQVYLAGLPDSRRKTLLDFGCGNGAYLRQVRNSFREVIGFEPDRMYAAALASQLKVPVYGSSEELCAERSNTVDVITGHYVLEHVPDLKGSFNLFRALLRSGGLLYLTVPNIRSWEARMFKRQWHGLDPPRHVVFPERPHLLALAAEFGFDAPEISFAAFPNTLAASVATAILRRCHRGLLMGLIVPSWIVALMAPSGSLRIRMTRRGESAKR